MNGDGGRHNASQQSSSVNVPQIGRTVPPHLESLVHSHLRRGEVRPYISAATATSLAGEPRLEVGEPDAILPLIDLNWREFDPMGELVVGAIDQQAADAGSSSPR